MTRTSLWTATLIIAVLLAFTVTHTILAWQTTDSVPWRLNTDHFVLGSMHDKNVQPDLFPRDYLLNNSEAYAYYTPSYMLFIELAARQVDGDFLRALVLLHGPILALYLFTAFLLIRHVSASAIVAVLLALASVRGFYSLKDFWQVVGLETVLARTIALPAVLTASLCFVRALSSQAPAHGSWIATGIFIGLAAIIHPVTGIAFALAVGMTTLLAWKLIPGRRWLNLVLLIGATFVSALPIVVHTLQHSGGEPIADFPAYAEAFNQRVAMFPFDSGFGRIITFSASNQLMIGVLWLPLSLLSLYAMKTNQRSWTVWPYILCQLVYLWLLIDLPNNFLNVVVIVGIFYAWHWWRRDEENELVWLHMISSMIFVSFTLPILLRAVWLQFELASLTTLVSQLPRGARLLTLPVLIIVARLARNLLDRWKAMPATVIWIELVGLMSVVRLEQGFSAFLPLLFLLALRHQQVEWKTSRPVLFSTWLGLSMQLFVSLLIRDGGAVSQMVGMIAGGSVWLWLRYRLSTGVVFLGAIASLAIAAMILAMPVANRLDTVNRDAVIAALDSIKRFSDASTSDYLFMAVAVGAALYLLFHRDKILDVPKLAPWMLTPLLIAMGLQVLEAAQIINLTPETTSEPTEAYVLGNWARENTDPDALFFTQGMSSAEFRFWSQRSITMSHKDLGVFVALSQQNELAALTDRWARFVSLQGNELVKQAEAIGASYITVPATKEPLSLPMVYRTPNTIVYSLDDDQY